MLLSLCSLVFLVLFCFCAVNLKILKESFNLNFVCTIRTVLSLITLLYLFLHCYIVLDVFRTYSSGTFRFFLHQGDINMESLGDKYSGTTLQQIASTVMKIYISASVYRITVFFVDSSVMDMLHMMTAHP